MVDESSMGEWSVVGHGEGGVVSDGKWGVVGNGNLLILWSVVWSVDSVGNWLSVVSDWSSNGLNDGWGRTVNDGIESVDWVSGVGNGPHGTIGLDKGVLSLDNISVSGLMSGLLVSGEGIRDRVSVIVLWMRIVWLSTDGGLSIGYWSVGYSDGCVGDGMSHWGSIVYWGGDCVVGNGHWSVGVGGSSICMSNGASISQWSSWGWGCHGG